jgi:hypothetical protein
MDSISAYSARAKTYRVMETRGLIVIIVEG